MIAICIVGLIITALISLFIYKKSKNRESFTKACLITLVSILILSTGLELTLFNINFYTSKGNTPTDLTHYIEEYKTEDGCYTFSGGEQVEFPELNIDIKNIKIDLNENNKSRVKLTLFLTDEGNEYYYATPQRTIYKSVEKSEYININTSGKSEHLMLRFDSEEDVIKVDSISINNERPFEFSVLRIFFVTAVLFFIYIFKPSSPLYKKELLKHQNLKYNLTVAIITVQCILIVFVGTMNPTFLGMTATENGFAFTPLPMPNHNQYDELAQAILEGKTYIDNNDVPKSLIDMENPYDTAARSLTSSATGDEYRWDVAYFDAHYYVYFGIVPLLIMYLPFRALFDAPFPSAIGIMIFAMLFTIGVFKLLELICKKHFKKISVGTYLLLSLTFVNCCGTMFLVKRPDFYSVPIMTAMTFVVWGLYCWIKGKDEKKQNLYFFLGSLFSALTVGCRPQFVLICAVAIPVFFKYFFKEKQIFNKNGIKNLVALAVPFVIVAAGIMYYNYIRFASPFDFGSAYNLTTNDVTKRGFNMGRTGLGIFTYLFQPPQFTAVFPYIKAAQIETNYIGRTIYEYCFGGLITSLPVLWFIFALPKVKDVLKEKNLFSLVLTLLGVGFALVIADTQAGGLLQRYYSDFGFIFFLASTLVIFALSEKEVLRESNIKLNSLLFISTILSVVYTIALVFSVADVTIDTQNPTLYAKILHLFEFWI